MWTGRRGMIETKDDGNDDGEESRRVSARLAADRDERIDEKFRREAGSQDTARRIDWVTEIIRTMSDARLVKRFFSAGRRSVSCFRERSDKGTKVPTGREDTIAERATPRNQDQGARRVSSSISLNNGDITAPQWHIFMRRSYDVVRLVVQVGAPWDRLTGNV